MHCETTGGRGRIRIGAAALLGMGISVASGAHIELSLDAASSPADYRLNDGTRSNELVQEAWQFGMGALYFSVDRLAQGAPESAVWSERLAGSGASAQGDIFELVLPGWGGGPATKWKADFELGLDEGFFEDDIDGLNIRTNQVGVEIVSGYLFRTAWRFSTQIGQAATHSGTGAWETIGPEDILFNAGASQVYADGIADMGLQPGDSIDGLCLQDFQPDPDGGPGDFIAYYNGKLDRGLDFALFSLDPASPSAAALGGPGAILYSDFVNPPQVFLTPADLGLLPGDNVDAIALVPEPGVAALLVAGGIGLVWRRRWGHSGGLLLVALAAGIGLAPRASAQLLPYVHGDADLDGDIDLRDFAEFQQSRHPSSAAELVRRMDFNDDGRVDIADWLGFAPAQGRPEEAVPCAGSAVRTVNYCGFAPDKPDSFALFAMDFDSTPGSEALCFSTAATDPLPGINLQGTMADFVLPQQQADFAAFYGVNPSGAPDAGYAAFHHSAEVAGKTLQFGGSFVFKPDRDQGVFDIRLPGNASTARYLLTEQSSCGLNIGLSEEESNSGCAARTSPLQFCAGETKTVYLCLYLPIGDIVHFTNVEWRIEGGDPHFDITPRSGTVRLPRPYSTIHPPDGGGFTVEVAIQNVSFPDGLAPVPITIGYTAWSERRCCYDKVDNAFSVDLTAKPMVCSITGAGDYTLGQQRQVGVTVTNPCTEEVEFTWQVIAGPPAHYTVQGGGGTETLAGFADFATIVDVKNESVHGPPVPVHLAVQPAEGAKVAACNAQNELTFEPPRMVELSSLYSKKTASGEGEQRPAYLYEASIRTALWPTGEDFLAIVDWRGHPAGSVRFTSPMGTVAVPTAVETIGGEQVHAARRNYNIGSGFPVGSKLTAQAVSPDTSRSKPMDGSFDVVASPYWPVVLFFHKDIHSPPLGPSIAQLTYTALGFKFSPTVPGTVNVDGNSIPPGVPGQGGQAVEWGPTVAGKAEFDGTNRTAFLQAALGAARGKEARGSADRRLSAPPNVPAPRTYGSAYEAALQAQARSKLVGLVPAWKFDGGQIGLAASGSFACPVSPVPFPCPVIGVPACYWQIKMAVELELNWGIIGYADGNPPATKKIGNVMIAPSVEGVLGFGIPSKAAIEGYGKGGGKFGFREPPADPAIPNSVYQLDVVFGGGIRVIVWYFTLNGPNFECTYSHYFCQSNCFQCSYAIFGQQRADESPWQMLPRDYLWGDFAAFHPDGPAPRAARSTVEHTLVSNEFPYPTPDLTRVGDALAVVWTTDDPARPDPDRTKAVYSVNNGSGWSAPAPLDDDGTTDFDPQLVALPGGNAVAAWTNANAPLPGSVGLETIGEYLEIAAAVYDATLDTWSAPAALTANGHLDFNPRLSAAPDGRVMLVWMSNPDNDVLGGGAPTTIHYSIWDAGSWSPAATAATGIAFPGDLRVAYRGDQATLLYSDDVDGDPTTTDDWEIYAATFNGAAWSPAARLTDDTVPDVAPQVAYDAGGNLLLVWTRDGSLVSATDLGLGDQQTAVSRPGMDAGVAHYDLARAPDGRLCLVWPQGSGAGMDLWYAYYDVAAGGWSTARQLTADEQDERDVSAAFDPAGQLAVAYRKVNFARETRTITFQGEEYVLDVPIPDSTDLNVLTHAFALDLDVNTNSIGLDTNGMAPGDINTLGALVTNQGDVPVSHVQVAFYDGDPDLGGTLIGSVQTIAGPLAGGASADVLMPFTVPAGGQPLEVFVVVDPAELTADVNRANNKGSAVIIGPDLEVVGLRAVPDSLCTREIHVQISNVGAVDAGPSTLAVREGEGGPLLYSTVVGPVAAADSAAEIVFPLASPAVDEAGTLTLYVTVDDGNAVAEADESTNTRALLIDLNPREAADCNENHVVDACDIQLGHSSDLDSNGVPDECDDCNTNGLRDVDEIAAGSAPDCNTNGRIDACDVAQGYRPDANSNGVPDDCEDCNTNGVVDEFDISGGIAPDCNTNGVPDACDVAGGSSPDCNSNGVPDECAAEADVDTDGVPDACDNCPTTANADQADFDHDGAGDACDLDADGDGAEGPGGSGQDCDDTSPFVGPGLSESPGALNCDDGLDNDCDGSIDGADSNCPQP